MIVTCAFGAQAQTQEPGVTHPTVTANTDNINPVGNQPQSDGIRLNLDKQGGRFVKLTGLAQIWVRYNDNNPGSAVYGDPRAESFDVGLRRVRYQALAQISDRVFFYSQFGINSLNYLSVRKTGLFFHDVTAEYTVAGKLLVLGCGLNGWNGTVRFTSSSVSSILAMDLPMILETTNDVNDQFVRRYGIYAKGQVGSFDYRLSAGNPFPVQNALSAVATLPATVTNTAYYSTKAPKVIYQGYFMWQFLDKESNQLPYMTGSYLGKKRVLNVGAGFTHQPDAMWYRNVGGDTVSTALQQIGVDVFFDSYLDKEKETAVTAYAAFLNYDYGPNYVRNVGAMNTANSTVGNSSFNGAGNAFPLIGTGQMIYGQVAYLFQKDLLKSHGTLQPYLAGSYALYERLKSPVVVYNTGVNWIITGQKAKISLDYQSRPVFDIQLNGDVTETRASRRGQIVLQFQVMF